MFAPPITGSGASVLVRRRSAPLFTVVLTLWVLLVRLVSLSEVTVAVPAMTAPPPPATSARQVRLMVLRSAGSLDGLETSVPMEQVTSVALVATQLGFGVPEAVTKLAPLGTVNVRTVLVAASSAELSMPTA